MPYKPMTKREFEKCIHAVGWTLEKGSIDWKLYDEEHKFVCTIKITHPGGEVIAMHVNRVKKEFDSRGLLWNQKKSQKKK